MIQQILRYCIVGENAVWDGGMLDWEALGFWTKAMPSAAENYTAFEKQTGTVLALGETECLTTGYQGTTYPGACYELGRTRPTK